MAGLAEVLSILMLCHCHGIDLCSQKNICHGYIVYRSEDTSEGNNREWQQPTAKTDHESATGSSSNDYTQHIHCCQYCKWLLQSAMNVPLPSSIGAPNPVPLILQPQFVFSQPPSSVYPTQGVYPHLISLPSSETLDLMNLGLKFVLTLPCHRSGNGMHASCFRSRGFLICFQIASLGQVATVIPVVCP